MTTMSTFEEKVTTPPPEAPSPTKHVNYTQGMVLGVDEFLQEFAYLSGHDQWMARDLIGYGTACGLRVSLDYDGGQRRVVVDAGAAVSPKGQMISVPAAQCAYLNGWLNNNQADLTTRFGTPATSIGLRLYVVLCYRPCLTDKLPVPGEPCRTEDEAVVPTRISDDFQLDLRLNAPDQTEEDTLRRFVAWLKAVEISDTPPATPLDVFEDALRQAAHEIGSPLGEVLSPPTFMIGSPPSNLRIPAWDACTYLRTAFRLWVTEFRPRLFGPEETCTNPPNEDCVLLAELDVWVVRNLANGIWSLSDPDSIVVDETRRPFLVHLRLLQEWLLCGSCSCGALPAPFSPPSASSPLVAGPITLGGDVSGPSDTNIIDRIRGTLIDPAITAGTPGQVISFAKTGPKRLVARTIDDNMSGDVSGTTLSNTVDAIRKVPVSPAIAAGTRPNDGEMLTYRKAPIDAWVPAPVQPKAGLDPTAVHHTAVSYDIVAAGIVGIDANDQRNDRAPVYNDLHITKNEDGRITLIFKGYTQPTASKFQYIVKALPVVGDGKMPINVDFGDFLGDADGFTLRVFNVTTSKPAVPRETIATLQFMIEISRFEAKV